jgi:hypothetical protein
MKVSRYENDDIPQEKVARIYQEQLSKLSASARLGEDEKGIPMDLRERLSIK